MTGAISITDMYMSVLSSLSNDDKLALIEKLSASMRAKSGKNKEVETDPFACYKGDWTGDFSADGLKESRTFNRNVENW